MLYDGNPARPTSTCCGTSPRDAGITTFGTSAAYIAALHEGGRRARRGPRPDARCSAVGSTGSPLSPEGFEWVYDQLGADTWLFSTSGGTDVCTAFVGGVPTLPVYQGELQARSLGCDVEAWDEDGNAAHRRGRRARDHRADAVDAGLLLGRRGRRAATARATSTMYPGVWRHGDWIEITERGTAIIYGRSDSTINRGGVRMGTSEIYRAVLALDEIVDALVVDVPREGDGELDAAVRRAARRRASSTTT